MNYETFSLIFIQIITFIYTMTVFVIYQSKKKIMSIDNYIFTFMFISVLVSIFLDAISAVLPYMIDNIPLIIFINRLYTLFLDLWLISFALYTIILLNKKNSYNIPLKEDPQKNRYFKLIKYTLLISIIVSVLNFILPMNTVPGKNWLVDGIATYLSYVIYGICMVILIVCTIIGKNKLTHKTHMAVLSYTLISLLSIAVSFIIVDLYIFSFVTGFITSLMYFTLENPDLTIIEETNIAKIAAEKANMAKTEFLTNMSNEIKTPLNAIVGFSTSLANENVSDKTKDEINHIIVSANNLLDIVNDILDISKIESGKIEFAEIDYDSNKLFEATAENCSRLIGTKPIKLKSEIDNKIPPVLHGDKYRLKQILMNILSNAVKFTKEGTISYIVSGETTEDNKCKLTIIIDDTGKGISESDLKNIFSTFQRLDIVENSETLGTGLGLAITKDLIDLMGGTIRVESELGKGTKFTIELDQIISDKDINQLDNETEDYKPFDASSYRVVVVDDNNVNLRVAKQLMKDYNLDPELLNNGDELLSKIDNGVVYDLIFLDEVMPKISGSEILKELHKKKNFRTPIVALTANQESNAKDNFLQSGFNNYLAKPIVKEQLYIIMKQYLKENLDTTNPEEEKGSIVTFKL